MEHPVIAVYDANILVPSSVSSVAGLHNNRRRATNPQQKLPKLRIDVFVAALNEELGVLNYLEDCPSEWQRLRGNLGAVAIVNAVVPLLEQIGVALFHLVLTVLDRMPPLIGGKRDEGGAGDPEKSLLGVGMNYPVGHPVPEELFHLTHPLDLLGVMQKAFIFIKPDPAVLRKDDVPEVEDFLNLEAVLDVRDDFPN